MSDPDPPNWLTPGASFSGILSPEGGWLPCLANVFTNEQIPFALRQAENGATVDSVCSKMDVPEATFYPGKKQFVGMSALDRLRGRPKSLRVNNGAEFAGRMLDQWAYLNGVEIDFSRPGKPTDNAYTESFNGRLRAERLNAS